LNSFFSLRALAARKMRRKQRPPCRRAAREAAIRVACSMHQAVDLRFAFDAGFRDGFANDNLLPCQLNVKKQREREIGQSKRRVWPQDVFLKRALH
jgi:hypothetical protein